MLSWMRKCFCLAMQLQHLEKSTCILCLLKTIRMWVLVTLVQTLEISKVITPVQQVQPLLCM